MLPGEDVENSPSVLVQAATTARPNGGAAVPVSAGFLHNAAAFCRGGTRRHQPALAAYRQKSGIHSCGAGLSAATWVSKMATVPVDGVMCADVPVPPTQP